jgi:hypothetical protein
VYHKNSVFLFFFKFLSRTLLLSLSAPIFSPSSYPFLILYLFHFIGLRDMGIALVLGLAGATAWSQVAHANRRDWEQANRVSA